MRKAVILLITLFTVLSSQAQDVQSFVSRQLQTYPKKSLNLLDIQPLTPDPMQQIFIKLQ